MADFSDPGSLLTQLPAVATCVQNTIAGVSLCLHFYLTHPHPIKALTV